MDQHNIIKKVNDIMKDCGECTLAIINQDGSPHAATRSFCRPANILGGYISSNTSGNLVQSVLKNSAASMCIRQGNNNITLDGTLHVVQDREKKNEMWLDWFINHYKGGMDDPEYSVIEFRTQSVSLWIDGQVVKFDVSTFTQPVSYCGLLCSTCDFVQSNGCKGCIATMGHPFYGECKIAGCAIAKGYQHCGQCPDMPCADLHEYSCGDGEHCDRPKGARLEILEMWNR